MKYYNFLLEKGVLPLGDKLLGSTFIQQLQEFRYFDTLSLEALEQVQLQRLESILKFATKYSGYYKSIWQYDNTLTPLQNLKSFPILTKEILRTQTKAIFTESSQDLNSQSSSGSSGIQSTVYLSKKEQSVPQAQQTRWWEWSGYQIGNSILQTGMTPKRGLVKGVKDVLFKTQYTPAFSLSKEEIKTILVEAQQKKIQHFFGYASSLFLFAEVAEEAGIDIQFESIVSWGDKLFDHYRKKLESVFRTKVFETYGSAEGFMIASQKDLDYLYLMIPGIYLELLDDAGNEVSDGMIGQVVVTNLSTRSFPLIRYQLGDLAIKLPKAQYPAERELNYPLLQKVIGRDTDIVRTPSGKSLVVHTFTGIFEFFPEIQQFRVIQQDISGIVIEYIPREGFHKNILNKIQTEILGHLKEDFTITFKEVSHIPATPSGKPQIIQNLLPK